MSALVVPTPEVERKVSGEVVEAPPITIGTVSEVVIVEAPVTNKLPPVVNSPVPVVIAPLFVVCNDKILPEPKSQVELPAPVIVKAPVEIIFVEPNVRDAKALVAKTRESNIARNM